MSKNELKDLDTAIKVFQQLRDKYGNLSIGGIEYDDFEKDTSVYSVDAAVVTHPLESERLLVIFD